MPKQLQDKTWSCLYNLLLLKISSFHTPCNNFWCLNFCHIHLSYRRKNDKKSCLKYLIHCCFLTYFPASFLLQFLSRKLMQAHTSSFLHQTKTYRTCTTKCPSAWKAGICRLFQYGGLFWLLYLRFTYSQVMWLNQTWTL